jgi:hypothetical protein
MTKGKFEESVRALEQAIISNGGNPRLVFDHLRSNEAFAARTARFMIRGGREEPPLRRRGREVFVFDKPLRAQLGMNFWGVEEWSILYGVEFSSGQIREIPKFPWSEDILHSPCPFYEGKKVKDTHFAFLGLERINGEPLTIMKWHELHPASGQPKFYFAKNLWYNVHRFAVRPTCSFRWYLMLLEPNSDSRDLPEGYEKPLAVEEVTKDILYYRKSGIYLNPDRYGYCRDVTVGGGYVYVGQFNRRGLRIRDPWFCGWFNLVGSAASRKLPS